MNFLFVYPTLLTEAPMTIGLLSAVVKEEGWNTFSIVNTFKKPLDIDDFVNKAREVKADIVGITIMTFEVLFVYKVIKALKKAGFKVIVGGAHATDCPEEVLKSGADIVVVGEGEESIREVLRNPKIRGIILRKPRLELSTLPKPDLDVFDQETFRGEDGFIKGFHRIYTSRGCPGTCTFCDWQMFKQIFKTYNTKKIVDNIKERRDKYGITSFSIADDCFTVVPENVYEFCRLIKPLKVIWRTNSRANLVNLDMLKAMKDAGCHSIAFGLESGDPETLKRIGKRVTLEENIRAPKLAHQAGLEVYGCLMTGFPWETVESVENQIKFIHELWNDVSLFQVSGSLIPYPGAPIYRQYAKKYGFENWWLKPKYQSFGIQIYQNCINPFKVSTYYQRYLFDDTYIKDEYFFKYTPEYKKAVKKLVWGIGKHNLLFMFPNRPFKQKLSLVISELSMWGDYLFPGLEKSVGGYLFEKFHSSDRRTKIEKIRDNRRGIKKSYGNPN